MNYRFSQHTLRQAFNSIVRVNVAGGAGIGTGVVLKDGIFVSVGHAIPTNVRGLTLYHNDQRIKLLAPELLVQRFELGEEGADYAVIQDDAFRVIQPLSLNTRDPEFQSGMSIFALGYPAETRSFSPLKMVIPWLDPFKGSAPAMTYGTLTSFLPPAHRYKMNMRLNPGQSGGPMLTEAGQVIAISESMNPQPSDQSGRMYEGYGIDIKHILKEAGLDPANFV